MSQFDDGGSIVQSKVGRFPVWMIGLVLALLVVGFLWWRKRGQKTAPSQDTTAQGDQAAFYDGTTDGVYGLPPGAIGDYLNDSPLDPAYPTGLTPQGIPGPITNVQWSRLAQDWLLGQGNDPALIERALAKYLQGASLSTQEQAIINIAQRTFGAPPEGPILLQQPTPETPSPTPTTSGGGGTTNTERRSVTVARYTSTAPPWNSTLGGIARHFNTSVGSIIAINNLGGRPKAGGAPVIYTGERLWIDP